MKTILCFSFFVLLACTILGGTPVPDHDTNPVQLLSRSPGNSCPSTHMTHSCISNTTSQRIKRDDDLPELIFQNPQGPDDGKFLEFSTNDLLLMAEAGLNADYDSPMFLKYFQAGDKDFVKQTYENILGPKDDDGDYMGKDIIFDPTKLKIFRSPIDQKYGIFDMCNHPLKTSYIRSDGDVYGPAPNAITDFYNAFMVFCPATIKLLIPLDERDCDRVGDRVNQNGMVPTGFFLFHELFHWTALVNPRGRRLFDRIIDVWGTPDDPPIAPYGAYDVTVLNLQKPEDAVKNAENFAWFALEAYYTAYCGKNYLPAEESESSNPTTAIAGTAPA